MARLNTANPQADHAPRRKAGLKDQGSNTTYTSDRHNRQTSNRPLEAPAPKHKKTPSTMFDIFPDHDAAEESMRLERNHSSSSASPAKQKKKRTLKAAHVNSLLLPFQEGRRHRPNIKVETDDYEKENDIAEGSIDPFETTMESVPQRPPIRRNTTRTSRRSRPNDRPVSPISPQTETADEGCGDNSFNSLDDFIVSDNDEPSSHETSDSETEDQKSSTPSPPPKPTRRRLIRGRRPGASTEEKWLKDSAVKAPFSLEPKIPDSVKSASGLKDSPRHVFQEDLQLSTQLNELTIDDDNGPSSQLETDLTRSVIELDSSPAQAPKDDSRPSTPMHNNSLSPARLRSLAKGKTRIPPTPHRESSDAFWSQDVTNDWIDHHSPRKQQTPSHPVMELLQEFDDTETEGSSRDSTEPEPLPRVATKAPSTPKTPSKTAIKKAAAAEKRAAKERRAEFDSKKAQFAQTFLETLDHAVTGGLVLKYAQHTGGVQIVWSKSLLKTAGRATWRGERQVVQSKTGENLSFSVLRHHCKIELAERIIDSEYRLLNTLTHEYCHLANYMISSVHDNPHGPSFKLWGQKCTEVMKDHPLYGGQIHVTTRHSYQIDYKYVWSCMGCKLEYGRHSKSIDTTRMTCGSCKSSLEQIKPKPRNVSPKKNGAFPAV